jgi:hypothetical protein
MNGLLCCGAGAGAAGMSSSGVDVPQAVRKLPGAAATDGCQSIYETVPGEFLTASLPHL